MRKLNLSGFFVAWVAVAVVACNCPAPTKTPTEGVPTQTLTEMIAEMPTELSTAIPTDAPMVTLTKIPTATPTEAPTPTRTPWPTSTSTQMPTLITMPEPTPAAIGSFRLLPQTEGWPSGDILDLRFAPDGTLWLVTEEGVGSLHGGTWTRHFSGHGGILAGFDDAGRTWLILDRGSAIASWDGTSWTTYGSEAGWTPATFYWADLITDRRRAIWLSSIYDVRVFDGRIWVVYTSEEIGLVPHPDYSPDSADWETELTGVALDSDGNVWIGGCYVTAGGPAGGPGARWFNGRAWEGADSHVVGSGCVTDIEVDAAGNVWVAKFEAFDSTDLWRYTSGEGWTCFTLLAGGPADSYPIYVIANITPGLGGTVLWITTEMCLGAGGGGWMGNALFRFQVADGTWSQILDIGEYEWEYEWGSAYVSSIDDLAVDATGTAFLCNAGCSVYRVAAGSPELLAELPMGDSWSRCYIEVDPDGRVWAASEDRLWVYEPTEGE